MTDIENAAAATAGSSRKNQARLWMSAQIRRAISSFIFVDAPPSNLYHLKKLVGVVDGEWHT